MVLIFEGSFEEAAGAVGAGVAVKISFSVFIFQFVYPYFYRYFDVSILPSCSLWLKAVNCLNHWQNMLPSQLGSGTRKQQVSVSPFTCSRKGWTRPGVRSAPVASASSRESVI